MSGNENQSDCEHGLIFLFLKLLKRITVDKKTEISFC